MPRKFRSCSSKILSEVRN